MKFVHNTLKSKDELIAEYNQNQHGGAYQPQQAYDDIANQTVELALTPKNYGFRRLLAVLRSPKKE